jgi:hypothetical protein
MVVVVTGQGVGDESTLGRRVKRSRAHAAVRSLFLTCFLIDLSLILSNRHVRDTRPCSSDGALQDLNRG